MAAKAKIARDANAMGTVCEKHKIGINKRNFEFSFFLPVARLLKSFIHHTEPNPSPFSITYFQLLSVWKLTFLLKKNISEFLWLCFWFLLYEPTLADPYRLVKCDEDEGETTSLEFTGSLKISVLFFSDLQQSFKIKKSTKELKPWFSFCAQENDFCHYRGVSQ